MPHQSRLVSAHPVIPVRNMNATLEYYTDRLGFEKVFDDADGPGRPISYAGVRRDGICLPPI